MISPPPHLGREREGRVFRFSSRQVSSLEPVPVAPDLLLEIHVEGVDRGEQVDADACAGGKKEEKGRSRHHGPTGLLKLTSAT